MKVIDGLFGKGCYVEIGVERHMNRLSHASRLTLGTAQLGMQYGVVRMSDEPGPDRARRVLNAAWDAGINCLDTARTYGEAEIRIGAWRDSRQADPILISKLTPLPDPDLPHAVETEFTHSANALGVDYIDGYLCHRPADLRHKTVLNGLARLVEKSRIGAFGVSVYSEEELQFAIRLPIGIVQLPLSLANLSFARNGSISAASERGILVFARSVYLQGVLISSPDRLPNWLSPLVQPLRRLHALAANAGTTVPALALAAVNVVPGVKSIVVGAETPDQLAQSIAALQATPPEPAVIAEARSLFMNVPSELTDPSRWPAD